MILTVVVIPLIRWGVQKVKSSVDADKLNFAVELSRQLVMAAEQNGLKDGLEKYGEEKKAYVIARLEAELAKHGIYLDLNFLSDLVEAQVYEAINAENVAVLAANSDCE